MTGRRLRPSGKREVCDESRRHLAHRHLHPRRAADRGCLVSHAREYRLINRAAADHRACWWNGSEARLTIPVFLQEDIPNERTRDC